MNHLIEICLVGIGSFIGGVARHMASLLLRPDTAPAFPWATLCVNLSGCLLIGLLYGAMERWNISHPHFRLFLMVGLCGGFTTFSTFSHEAFIMLRSGHYWWLASYICASFLIGLLLLASGYLALRR